MSYRRPGRPSPAAPRSKASWRLGLGLGLLLVGSVAVHAVDVPRRAREAALQSAWSRVATCVFGAPLAPGETPSSRLRVNLLFAAHQPRSTGRVDPLTWPLRCTGMAMELALDLDDADPAEHELRAELRTLSHDFERLDADALVAAALARGLGHATAVGRPPTAGHLPRASSLVAFDPAISDLTQARFDPVGGDRPTVVFAGGATPRICRWRTTVEPLDGVDCWNIPVNDGGRSSVVIAGSLADARPLTRGFLGADHRDARTGEPIRALAATPPADGADAHRAQRRVDDYQAASLAEDGTALLVDGDGWLNVVARDGTVREVLALPNPGLFLLPLRRDVAWARENKGMVTGELIHIDARGTALRTRLTGGQEPWGTPRMWGCESRGTRAFVIADQMSVAAGDDAFPAPTRVRTSGAVRGKLVCLDGGEAAFVAVTGGGVGNTVVARHESAAAKSEDWMHLAAVADGLPVEYDRRSSEPLEAALPGVDVGAVGGDVIIVIAEPGAGVFAVRARVADMFHREITVLADDLDAPAKAVRVVSDGRAVVALIEDADAVRALRRRPDGTWVAQVARELPAVGSGGVPPDPPADAREDGP